MWIQARVSAPYPRKAAEEQENDCCLMLLWKEIFGSKVLQFGRTIKLCEGHLGHL